MPVPSAISPPPLGRRPFRFLKDSGGVKVMPACGKATTESSSDDAVCSVPAACAVSGPVSEAVLPVETLSAVTRVPAAGAVSPAASVLLLSTDAFSGLAFVPVLPQAVVDRTRIMLARSVQISLFFMNDSFQQYILIRCLRNARETRGWSFCYLSLEWDKRTVPLSLPSPYLFGMGQKDRPLVSVPLFHFSSGRTTMSMVIKQASPPTTLEIGSAANTPAVPIWKA